MPVDVSLCIINRDNRDNLVRLVKEARPWVSEIVVVDTGSTDGSVNAVQSAGADNVSERPDLIHEDGFISSFANARNASYELAQRPWIMNLDTDDTLRTWDELAGVVARAEHERQLGRLLFISLPYEIRMPGNELSSWAFQKARLSHRDDCWRWVYPVHEQLSNDADSWEGLYLNSPTVLHLSERSGQASDRNLAILRRWEKADGPQHPEELWFYLGDEMYARERYVEAFQYYDRIAGLKTQRQASAALRAGRCLRLQNKIREMLEYYEKWVNLAPTIANFYWEVGYTAYKINDVKLARYAMSKGSNAPHQVENESTYPRDVVAKWLSGIAKSL